MIAEIVGQSPGEGLVICFRFSKARHYEGCLITAALYSVASKTFQKLW